VEKPPGIKTLFLGTTFADLPTAVQEAIRREAGEMEILKIDRHRLAGEPRSYFVEIKGGDGAFQLRIAEDGRVLTDTRRGSNQPIER